jgi:UPF0042 nucleotide-binding protein
MFLGRIVVITGLSGSGKSTALSALEDNGFFCIDNLPILLLPKFLALREQTSADIFKLGLVMDLREKEFISQFQDVFEQIKGQYDLTVIFLEANDQVLVKRYSETRRRHPLAENRGLLEGIQRERELMAPIRQAANDWIDTSEMNTHALRERIIQRYAWRESRSHMSIELLSFGFKYGLPPEADIIMDVRFLPNPFYVDHLRDLDGRDQAVVEYVMAQEEGRQFVKYFRDLIDFVVPLYRREGKSYLVIAIGCTGGQHRSVTVVRLLAEQLTAFSDTISIRHRDVTKKRD